MKGEGRAVGILDFYISSDITCPLSAQPKLTTTTVKMCGVHKHRLSVRLALQVFITHMCFHDRDTFRSTCPHSNGFWQDYVNAVRQK